MPKKIAHAVTTEFKRRDGSTIHVQEWPTLAAMDAMDEIVEAYDELKRDGVIKAVMGIKIGAREDEEIDNLSQADSFVGVLKALKGYRPLFLKLLCSSIVVGENHDDYTEETIKDWFADEWYDLIMAVYDVNFKRGSLKKVQDKMGKNKKTPSKKNSKNINKELTSATT